MYELLESLAFGFLVSLRAYLKSDLHEDPFWITYGLLLISAGNLGIVLYKLTN